MSAPRSVTLVTAPTIEPVSVDDVKLFARIDTTDEDSLIDDFIQAARVAAELYTRRSFITQTHKLTLDLPVCGWASNLPEGVYDAPQNIDSGPLPSEIRIPKTPLQSVTSVVTYDLSDAATTFSSSSYTVSTASGMERISLKYGQIWPVNLRTNSACEITYVAGYGSTAADVPAPIRMGIKMHAAKLYETRGMCGCDDPPDSSRALYDQYRVRSM